MDILKILSEIIGAGVGITLAITVISRVVPNSKLYGWGVKIGQGLNRVGTARLGGAWEDIEDFLINSIGQLFNGIKDGFDDSDLDPKVTNSIEDESNVRL